MARFYEEEINARYEVDPATRHWQKRMLEKFNADLVTRQIRDCLVANGIDRDALPPVRFLSHHRTHAAGAYFFSGFEDAAILTLDGSGEEACTALWTGRGRQLEQQREFPIPHSLGWYYAALTEYLGFRAYNGEYKVMGLAPYGKANGELSRRLREVLRIDREEGAYTVDPSYIHYGEHSYSGRFTDDLVELLGNPPRVPDADPTGFHKEVAYAGQDLLEEIGVALARRATTAAGSRRVCLAGGTALNCKMSQRILESEWADDIFILPNAGDGGQALSAAMLLDHEMTGRRPEPLRSVALGPEFGDEEIKKILDECLLEYTYEKNVAERAARDVAGGKVVGWFQGRMEFGPRALGNRSILADPRHVASRDKVNAVVKYREYWRPFCPSLLAEAARGYFETVPSDAPFMTITFQVREDRKDEIPAVVHVDGSARPQLVHRDTHPLYHEMIRSFQALTNVPAVLNTSFNVKGEPIVCTPRDALRNYFTCGMDTLYLGSFRLEKKGERVSEG
jgi:carbamoyltransferase